MGLGKDKRKDSLEDNPDRLVFSLVLENDRVFGVKDPEIKKGRDFLPFFKNLCYNPKKEVCL